MFRRHLNLSPRAAVQHRRLLKKIRQLRWLFSSITQQSTVFEKLVVPQLKNFRVLNSLKFHLRIHKGLIKENNTVTTLFLTEQKPNMQCHWTVGQNNFNCSFIALKYGSSLWRKNKDWRRLRKILKKQRKQHEGEKFMSNFVVVIKSRKIKWARNVA